MAWEHAPIIFPVGRVANSDITIDKLDENMPFVDSDVFTYARSVVTSHQKYVWSKDGDFAIINLYDAITPDNCPDGESCLNAYGNMMLYNYKGLHK